MDPHSISIHTRTQKFLISHYKWMEIANIQPTSSTSHLIACSRLLYKMHKWWFTGWNDLCDVFILESNERNKQNQIEWFLRKTKWISLPFIRSLLIQSKIDKIKLIARTMKNVSFIHQLKISPNWTVATRWVAPIHCLFVFPAQFSYYNFCIIQLSGICFLFSFSFRFVGVLFSQLNSNSSIYIHFINDIYWWCIN